MILIFFFIDKKCFTLYATIPTTVDRRQILPSPCSDRTLILHFSVYVCARTASRFTLTA
jgi:hypothetical protein